MDKQRGVETGGAKGEVVDMQSGAVEMSNTANAGEGLNSSAVEKVGEVNKGVTQGMPSVSSETQTVVEDSGAGIGTTAVDQSELVNLTTKDGEKIEKEWVEKVQSIVKNTRDDPRKREDEVFEVKKNFIFKRFGRKIGKEKK